MLKSLKGSAVRRWMICASALGACVLATTSSAGEPVPRVLHLGDAERLLVERNLPLIAARQGVDISRAQKLVAATSPVPTLSTGINVIHIDDMDPNGGGPRVRADNPLRSINVGLSYVIERGGKLELRTRVADDQIGVAEAQVLDTLRQQLGALRIAYLTAVQARANLVVALQNRESLDATERLLRTRVRHGESAEGDLIRFQASRLQYDTDLSTNRIAYETAVRDVLASIGATAAQVEGDRLAGKFELGDATLAVEGDLATQPKPFAADQLRAAVENRPDVVAARHSVDVAQNQLELNRAQRWRDVTISPGISRYKADPSAGTQFSVGVSIPILNGDLVEANVMTATAQRVQAGTQAAQAQLQAKTEFDKALRSTELAEELVKVYSEAALQRAEDALRVSRAAYERGAQSLIDVLDAQRTLSQTRVAVNQARFTYLSSVVQLQQASGVDGLLDLR